MSTEILSEIADWRHAGEKFQSQYGFLTYREWCQREARRIGNGARVEENGNGGCRLVKPVAQW